MSLLNDNELREKALQFFTLFRQQFTPHLLDDIAVMVSIYPFPAGAVAVVFLNKNNKWKNEFKSSSDTMLEALEKTNMFDFKGQKPEFPTPAIAVTPDKIVLVKSNNCEQWSEKAVTQDIGYIISKVKKLRKTETETETETEILAS